MGKRWRIRRHTREPEKRKRTPPRSRRREEADFPAVRVGSIRRPTHPRSASAFPLSGPIFEIIRPQPSGRLPKLCPRWDNSWVWSRPGFPRGFGRSSRGSERVRDGQTLQLRRLGTLVSCGACFACSGSPHVGDYAFAPVPTATPPRSAPPKRPRVFHSRPSYKNSACWVQRRNASGAPAGISWAHG